MSKHEISASNLEPKSALLHQKSGLKLTDILIWSKLDHNK